MKMESENNAKSTTTTVPAASSASKIETDSGKLTFGPAW